MKISMFHECIEKTILFYRISLIADFELHPRFEKLASKLCFGDYYDIKSYVSDLQIVDFENRKYIGSKTLKLHDLRFSDMDQIDHEYQYVHPERYDEYYFFDKKQYNSYDELSKNYLGYFYLCNKAYISRLDDLFVEHLNGYRRRNNQVFEKSVGENLFLIVDTRKSRKHFETIEDYVFPLIYLEFDNTKYFFANEMDSFSFVFLAAKSYIHFFYKNRQRSNNSGEPVVYHDESSGIYTLTNSFENLARFNKFIFLNTDLFIHYFKLFEKWVTDIFVPELLSS